MQINMVMGNSKNSRVFNFAILLKSLAKYRCFTVDGTSQVKVKVLHGL